MERANTRSLTGYFERHHILPRCMGGTDNSNNIVCLTPEEHYVAHQLLVKLYPDHSGLAYAALQMTMHSNYDGRSGNKLYGWLRRKCSLNAKKRIGKKNGSYGRSWYHDPDTLKNGKFLKEEVPSGWAKGRVPKKPISNRRKYWFHDPISGKNNKFLPEHAPSNWKRGKHVRKRYPKENSRCRCCGVDTGSKVAKWCSVHRKERRATAVKERYKPIERQIKKEIITYEDKLNALKINRNIRQALFSLGLNDSGVNYRMMKELEDALLV